MKTSKIGLKSDPYPTKSKCLRLLRDIYPNARFVTGEDHAMGLVYSHAYKNPQTGRMATAEIPVLKLSPKAGEPVSKGKLAFAVTTAACAQLGYKLGYQPGFPSGKFGFEPIKDFKGPEEMIPADVVAAMERTKNHSDEFFADQMKALAKKRKEELAANQASTPTEAKTEENPK